MQPAVNLVSRCIVGSASGARRVKCAFDEWWVRLPALVLHERKERSSHKQCTADWKECHFAICRARQISFCNALLIRPGPSAGYRTEMLGNPANLLRQLLSR